MTAILVGPLRHHIGLLCTTILRDPEPMPPFRLPRRVSNLLTHHGLTASPASRPHTAAPPRARASLSAHPAAAGKQARLVSPGYLESCSVRSPEWCLIVVADLVHLWMSEKTHWIISGLRIHIWVCWANNSLTNNIVLIYIYTTIKETSIYSNIFGADKRLESILIKLIKSKISMA